MRNTWAICQTQNAKKTYYVEWFREALLPLQCRPHVFGFTASSASSPDNRSAASSSSFSHSCLPSSWEDIVRSCCAVSFSFCFGYLSLLYCNLVHIMRDTFRRPCLNIYCFPIWRKYESDILYPIAPHFKMYAICYSWLSVLYPGSQ